MYALAPLVAVPVILIAFRMLTEWSVAAGLAVYLGRRTLPIFVTHPLVVQFIGLAVAERETGVVTAGLLPIVALAIALGVGLTVELVLGRVPGVFEPPQRKSRVAKKVTGVRNSGFYSHCPVIRIRCCG